MQTYKTGIWGERICAIYLMLKGYRILECRFRSPYGEIDLIAVRNKCVVFIEVKTRTSLQHGLESISINQKKRIEKAAIYYVSNLKKLRYDTLRFDAVVVCPWKIPVHITNAW